MGDTVLVAAAGLLLAACASGTGAPPAASGTGPRGAPHSGEVSGRVLAEPRCPVERIGVQCAPGPVAGAVVVALTDGHATSTHTDSTGRFQLELRPGTYVIRATNAGGYRSMTERTVSVRAGSRTVLRLVVDSGIR